MKQIIEKLKALLNTKRKEFDNADSNEFNHSYEYDIQGNYKKALDFESSLRYMIEQSNKRAYLFAVFLWCFICISNHSSNASNTIKNYRAISCSRE